jgi:hypothetical protein
MALQIHFKMRPDGTYNNVSFIHRRFLHGSSNSIKNSSQLQPAFVLRHICFPERVGLNKEDTYQNYIQIKYKSSA